MKKLITGLFIAILLTVGVAGTQAYQDTNTAEADIKHSRWD